MKAATYSDEQVAKVRLNLVPGIGPRLFCQLIEHFGDAASVFTASPSELRTDVGISAKLVREIVAAKESSDALQELERCRQRNIDVLDRSTPTYPQRLTEIHDPPPILYRQGTNQPQDELAIAVVGTRHPSPYGKAQAERFARGLALHGITIVSGLARGIDAIAHSAALQAGGRTMAVIGSGMMDLYPPDHAALAADIARAGCVFSEFPTLRPPQPGAFPRRNRLISGMSLAVVVIEAGERSGALSTARHANDQGRDVFALPGRVDQRNARGCHRLIRDGAFLVESVDDILSELGPLPLPAQVQSDRSVHHPAELSLNEREQVVLQAIEAEATPIDAIVARTELPIQQVLSVVSVLEMRRLIRRVAGNALVRI